MAIGANKQKQFAEILEMLKEIEADLEKQLDTKPERSRSADFAGTLGIVKAMRQLNETLLEMAESLQRRKA